jgi:hypothetical protein
VTPGERLRTTIELAHPRLAEAAARLWTAPDVRNRYVEYLRAMHQVVRAAVPLMEFALARCGELGAADPVAGPLARYLRGHVSEESGHDEWVLQDLEAAGGDRAAALEGLPPARVAELVGAQYCWIRHGHPAALLGHMAVMEGYPPTPELLETLMAATGYGADAFRALRRHAGLDVRHRDELHRLLDELPLTARQQELAGLSALHTVGSVAALFEELAGGVEVAVDSGQRVPRRQ